jgi:hypothetical protein
LDKILEKKFYPFLSKSVDLELPPSITVKFRKLTRLLSVSYSRHSVVS